MSLLSFRLVSPERIVFEGEVHMVVLPGESGDLGVLAQHTPLVATLKSGLIRIYKDHVIQQQIFISSGLAQITINGLEVIAEEAIFIEELDVEKVDAYILKIRSDIAIAQNEEDKTRLRVDLQVAQAQKNVINRLTNQS
jgi:F-type H+-transporting ATPase subunit epsilon